jgi:galactokinase
VASAPGRVNLIGEHTDYNDGFVLPMAIDRRVAIAAAPRTDDRVVLHSETFGEQAEFSLGPDLRPGEPAVWSNYVAAVAWALRDAGIRVRGMDALVTGDVPLAAGLSSSAALEIASARAFCEVAGAAWEPVAMARHAQRAENEFVGVNCGIMDQLASACGRADSAMLLDCRSLEIRHFGIPADVVVVVMDTGVRRSLAGSEYNERRAACEAAVAIMRRTHASVRALRDVTPALLEECADRMDPVILRRATHVVMENARPAELAGALAAGDFTRAGDQMVESHASLRDLYEVSSVQLDLLCDLAREHPACFGARMTGAGFGGCAIALVRAGEATAFIADVLPRYEARSYKRSQFFIARPDEGARLD